LLSSYEFKNKVISLRFRNWVSSKRIFKTKKKRSLNIETNSDWLISSRSQHTAWKVGQLYTKSIKL
jgi:hypothetical protein